MRPHDWVKGRWFSLLLIWRQNPFNLNWKAGWELILKRLFFQVTKAISITAPVAAVLTFFILGVSVSCGVSPVKSLAVDPPTMTIYADFSMQLWVTAIHGDGAKVDVTNNSTYRSSDDTVASVSPEGMVNGENPGSANVTVSYMEGGITKTILVPVRIAEFGGTDTYSGVS